MGPNIKENNLKKLNAQTDLQKSSGCPWLGFANIDVSSCIIGFTKLSQVEENLKAL
jgi:aryl-alcohol dehydrogenase-like predicted oxidoreductase